QSRTKRLNRQAQQALKEAEMWSVAAGEYPQGELDALWKSLLLNQFHDILPGSSIDWVYEEAERDLSRVADDGNSIADVAVRSIAARSSRSPSTGALGNRSSNRPSRSRPARACCVSIPLPTGTSGTRFSRSRSL